MWQAVQCLCCLLLPLSGHSHFAVVFLSWWCDAHLCWQLSFINLYHVATHTILLDLCHLQIAETNWSNFVVSVSMGFFDDIFIPEDALHHPSKLYPLKAWFPVVGSERDLVCRQAGWRILLKNVAARKEVATFVKDVCCVHV